MNILNIAIRIILLIGILLFGITNLKANDFSKYKKGCDGGDAKGCEIYAKLNKRQ